MGAPPPLSHPFQPASVSSIRPEALLQFRHFPLRATRSQRNPGPLLGNPESPMETAFRTLPRRKRVATFGLCDEALPSQNRPRVLNPGPSLLLPARPQLCRGGGRENPKAKSHPHPAPDPQSDSQQATSPLCASASTCGNPRIGPVGLSEDFANLLVQEDLCGKWRVPPELPTSLLPPAWAPPPFPGPALATSAPRFGQKDLAPPRASGLVPPPSCPSLPACLFICCYLEHPFTG